jgi:NAD(P)-dependent dehydrogenase (short-subunit alcohol dehydrogenase family)
VGGNVSIGLVTAKRFASEGAHVFITARRDSELAATVNEIVKNVLGSRETSLSSASSIACCPRSSGKRADSISCSPMPSQERRLVVLTAATSALSKEPIDGASRLHNTFEPISPRVSPS